MAEVGMSLTEGYLIFIKIVVVVIELIYIFYAFLITRQVGLMTKSFKTDSGKMFKTIAGAHFIGSIIITAVSVFIL